MKKITTLGIVMYFSFFSCTKRLCSCDPVINYQFKAEVIQENNIDCQRPLILIDASDTALFRGVTGLGGNTFVASQLPSALKINGQRLYISTGNFGVGEDFTCTTIGPSYPHLKIITATAR
jgi:hypothetical protein